MAVLNSWYIKKAFLVGTIICLLAACQHSQKQGNTIAETPEELYKKSLAQMEEGSKQAVDELEKMEQYYPASILIPDAQILKAYIYYSYKKFDDAISAIDSFTKQYPQHKYADYMYYLKALCYYTEIVDTGRDQKITYEAIEALRTVREKFPNSKYAKDALWKEEYAFNTLAGKEMEVGRFYLKHGNLLSAINRFRTVLYDYDTTIMIPEALYRLVETHYALGITEEALKYAEVLKYNFADNIWHGRAQSLLGLEKKVNESR
ncbi:Outer membrane protein assembly factor BamD [Alphaproteobacteria bacterium]